jgi:hypothetical protein
LGFHGYNQGKTEGERAMSNAMIDVESLWKNVPDDGSLEDIQYHGYIIEKIKRGIERSHTEGTLTHEEAQARLNKWLSK